ncbi:MAG: ribosome hibernation-promoting factor, HPF/YfiA family [Bacilli bacterium]
MKVNIRGNGQVQLSPSARQDITDKVMALDKLFNNSEALVANVLCKGYEKYTVVEITIPMKQIILRAESKGDNLYIAVDNSVDKIERQLLRHKQKVNSFIRKREGIANYFSDLVEKTNEEQANTETQIKSKKIDLSVMTVDEAITQMELLDHDFYVFINEENHKQTIVYLRQDGGYGIIEPK